MKFLKLMLILTTITSCNQKDTSNQFSTDPHLNYSIIGGLPVDNHHKVSFFTVGLYDRKNKFLCTGSLIDKNKVLTAAHCIQGGGTNLVVIFDINFNSLDQNNSLRLRNVVSAWPHPDFKKNMGQDLDWADLAVIEFSGLAPEGYTPIEILTDDSILNRGSTVHMAGFGASRVDHEEVTKRDKKFRQRLASGEIICSDEELTDCILLSYQGFETLRIASGVVQGFTEKEIRLNENKGQGTCAGDSGGPLFIEHENKNYLIGVTSRGSPLCDGAAVYTHIFEFREWLSRYY